MKTAKLFLPLLVLSSYGLQAQEPEQQQANPIHPQLTATHTLTLGAFQQDADASFYADTNNQVTPKTEIDLGDLGMKESDLSWLAEYRYRMSDKWMLSVGGYKFDTSGSKESQKTFEYNGVKFETGAKVDSTLTLDTYILDVMYKVYGSDRAYLFVGGGVHVTDIGVELEAKGFINDLEGAGKRSNDDLLAPLPNLRAQGMYAFSPKWSISGTTGWLSLNYDDYEGSFAYISGRVSYLFNDHLGFGLGYQLLDMDFNVKRKNGEAGMDLQFNGPSAYITYIF